MKFTKDIIVLLLAFGFKRKYASDRSSYWYEKTIKSVYLGRIEFSVDETRACIDISPLDKKKAIHEGFQVYSVRTNEMTAADLRELLWKWDSIQKAA
jgi:hypothetical protein